MIGVLLRALLARTLGPHCAYSELALDSVRRSLAEERGARCVGGATTVASRKVEARRACRRLAQGWRAL